MSSSGEDTIVPSSSFSRREFRSKWLVWVENDLQQLRLAPTQKFANRSKSA